MKSVLQYQVERIRDGAGVVKEEPTQYIELLDKKIDSYMKELHNFEVKCSRPRVNSEHLLAEITVLNDTILEFCAKFERHVKDPEKIKAAQAYFREKTRPMLSKSYIINRVQTWPQGQQGDFMTLEINYRNTPLSEGIGYYLDRYFLSAPLAIAVRERLAKMRELLKNELDVRNSPKVLDVACGSCREVLELAPEIKASNAQVTCLDLDPDALAFARDRFSLVGLLTNNMKLLSYNALRMFDHETAMKEFGTQDVIYSLGFFDYLPDDFLVKLLKSLYQLLSPGGKLIAAFKEADRYRSEEFHWFAHWDGFMQRTKKDFDRLLEQAEIPRNTLTMTQIESGAILFYTATKK